MKGCEPAPAPGSGALAAPTQSLAWMASGLAGLAAPPGLVTLAGTLAPLSRAEERFRCQRLLYTVGIPKDRLSSTCSKTGRTASTFSCQPAKNRRQRNEFTALA